uniref:glucose-1-phosphate thymidylyltransferase n=1 Tax=viral metagenome TaxID=1070528 RepID=A0A6M3M0I3_9ZZZZ
MKGIILAGGKGTRLRPATYAYNKHLVSILNKPMILYPIETMKHFGVKDILIVTGGNHIGGIAGFLGDGSDYGMKFTYKVQKEAGGIAEALGLAEEFIGDDTMLVCLGDNVFDNESIPSIELDKDNATIFLKEVEGNKRFGVPTIEGEKITEIIEKPDNPKSKYAVTGLYYYPPDVFDVIKTLEPSGRGELEITDVNNYYVKNNKCKYAIVEGYWGDAGTPESLHKASIWAYGKKD